MMMHVSRFFVVVKVAVSPLWAACMEQLVVNMMLWQPVFLTPGLVIYTGWQVMILKRPEESSDLWKWTICCYLGFVLLVILISIGLAHLPGMISLVFSKLSDIISSFVPFLDMTLKRQVVRSQQVLQAVRSPYGVKRFGSAAMDVQLVCILIAGAGLVEVRNLMQDGLMNLSTWATTIMIVIFAAITSLLGPIQRYTQGVVKIQQQYNQKAVCPMTALCGGMAVS